MKNARTAMALISIFVAAAQAAWAQCKLPPCPGAYAANKWSNCYGTNMTNTGAMYAGEWLNDKFVGHGTYRYRNGTKYVGQFSDNRRNGQGSFTYPNGVKFVGEYRDDRRNGPGVEYGPDGKVLHAGSWENDVLAKRR